MRICCPYCGDRDSREFGYLGDAALKRPDPIAPDALGQFTAYVYRRDRTPGAHREFWYHVAGCHAWLVVTRNTLTHDILAVESAKEVRHENAGP